MENKIPKIIHYAWFGGTMPEHTKTYIKTWEKCNPDYQLKLWNESTFNINSYAFTREAYTYKKWAFLADFVRFWVLYHHGGIWLDTDVEVFRPFDDLLKLEYFIGNNSLNSHLDFSIIGACKGHPFIRLGMEEYLKRTFIDRNGNLNCEFSPKSLIENVMNRVYARHGIKVVKGTYDLDSLKTQQKKSQTTLYAIDNGILNSVHNTGNGKSFACHHHEGTWIKGNRLNMSDFTPEEIMEQQRKIGIYSTSKKEDTKDAPELLLIANTILCNCSMANNPGLTNGRMGVCLFLYEYARHTGIYILCEFNTQRKAHPNVKPLYAYIRAYNHKITAIFLTILSSVLGLVPFLIDGQDERFWFSFAVGSCGGLLFSIIALIFVLPVFVGMKGNKAF